MTTMRWISLACDPKVMTWVAINAAWVWAVLNCPRH